jgi:hypothetical protein
MSRGYGLYRQFFSPARGVPLGSNIRITAFKGS